MTIACQLEIGLLLTQSGRLDVVLHDLWNPRRHHRNLVSGNTTILNLTWEVLQVIAVCAGDHGTVLRRHFGVLDRRKCPLCLCLLVEFQKISLVSSLNCVDFDQFLHNLGVGSQLTEKVFFRHDHSVVVDRWEKEIVF